MTSLSNLKYFFAYANTFVGTLPSSLFTLPSLIMIDLRNNQLNGTLEFGNSSSPSQLKSLNLGNNNFRGPIPRSVSKLVHLDFLNISNNKIIGQVPRSLWTLPNLYSVDLSSNSFVGFERSREHGLSSSLPSDYFLNWSALPSSLGASEDPYMGDESGYYHDSVVLVNKGVELEYEGILKIYTALDFSGNRLEGEIPRSIGLLRELHVLNLSNNGFAGHIPSSMGNLTALESLDVSRNKLSGEIPQELGNLSFLAYMNFSHNHLVGLVPGGTQFRRQPCSSFGDNSGLYGPSLDDVCKDIHIPETQQDETPEAEEEDEDEQVFSRIAAAIGFGPGILFGLTIGYMLVPYKPEWFTNPFRRNKHRSRSPTTH